MEGVEIEMTIEELQKYIRGIVKTRLISTDTLEKYKLLQSLLEKREKQTAHLLKLYESVAACEAIVKKQYSLLGWEYKDIDSDDDAAADKTYSGNTSPSPCDVSQVPSSSTPNGCSPLSPKLGNSENAGRDITKQITQLKKQPVVVLTRIPLTKIRSLCPPRPLNHYREDEPLSPSTPQKYNSENEPLNPSTPLKYNSENEPLNPSTPQKYNSKDEFFNPSKPRKHNSEDESTNSPDSEKQWEPDNDTSDSDFSISNYNSGSNKRRKMNQKNEKNAESHKTQQASRKTDAKSKLAEKIKPQTSAKNNAESNRMQANTNDISPASTVTTLSQSSTGATKTLKPQSVPQGKISMNMNVLARKSAMNWEWGKIVKIVAKEDCRLKFLVSFKEEGQSFVTGHHIAFDTIPKADQLLVGARVVVKCQAEQPRYSPGFVAEFPCRKNRMRFLVFMDDHTPIYVGLPSLHLVCRPLADPFGDILDEIHRDFMREYVSAWPNPPQTNYKVGQKVDAELDGVQQMCEVKIVDSSLIQVFFPKKQQTEWIYRGSIRLQHMFQLRKKLELRRMVKQEKDDQKKIDSY